MRVDSKEDCSLSAEFPYNIKVTGTLRCGYLWSSDDGVTSSYLGSIKNIFIKNNMVFAKLYLGKDSEDARKFEEYMLNNDYDGAAGFLKNNKPLLYLNSIEISSD